MTVLEFLEQHELFGLLDITFLQNLESAIEVKTLKSGDFLFRQGDRGESLIILQSGALNVLLNTTSGDTLNMQIVQSGDIIGEIALLTGQPRSASVVATRESKVLSLSRQSFLQLLQNMPTLTDALLRKLRERIQRNQLAHLLYQNFGLELSQELTETITHQVEWLTLASGTTLYHQGDPSNAMYFVVSGRLIQVSTLSTGEEALHREVEAGSAVGLMAMLMGQPRATTVSAVRETILVRLSRELFISMTEMLPKMTLPMMRMLSQTASKTSGRSANRTALRLTYALIPLHPDIPMAEFGSELTKALSSSGDTLYLDQNRINDHFDGMDIAHTPIDSPLHTALAGWLGGQQTTYSNVLLVADTQWTAWTQNCVQFADRIILIGTSNYQDGWKRTSVEKSISDTVPHTRTELVLLHPDDTEYPKETRRWLQHRTLYTHHHVRLGDHKHYNRLARRLSGQAIGLVLSGGGARGFAHIGVFRALEEAGIEIDMVGGTSMGSIIAGRMAYEDSSKDLLMMTAQLGSNDMIMDRTLPLVALNRSRKVTDIYQTLFGDLMIEDSWIPFFCVATNLSAARADVIQSGKMALAVRASTAIPGVFTPILRDDDVLTDGGLMNNFPVDVMAQQIEGGTVIGVSVTPSFEKARKYDLGTDVSGWDVFWRRLNPFAKKRRVPSLVGTMMRCLEVNNLNIMRKTQSLADLLIHPDLSEFHSLNFDQHEGIIDAGYKVASAQIEEWLQNNKLPAGMIE